MTSQEDKPERKRRKTAIHELNIEKVINSLEKDGSLQKIKTNAKSLCESKGNSLGVIVIEHSNALLGYGVPFSLASCPTRIHMEQCFSFASVFSKGLAYFQRFIQDSSYVSDDENVRCAIGRLLGFTFSSHQSYLPHSRSDSMSDSGMLGLWVPRMWDLLQVKSKDFLRYLGQRKDLLNNETRLSAALAEHVLSKLAPSSDYILDDHCKRIFTEYECRCGCHTCIQDKFGNTSIGHPTVWHGNIDIVVGKDIPVTVELIDPENLGEESTGVKHHIKNESIEDFPIRSQMIAQTILFSFLQKKRHPNAENFLVPCIGMSARHMIFFSYDCKCDILLQSPPMPFTFGKDISHTGIMALWLVLNYKYFCSGLSPYMLEHASKAEFLKGASEDVKKIYMECLSFGKYYGRDMPCSEMFNPSIDERTQFIYPPDIPTFEW